MNSNNWYSELPENTYSSSKNYSVASRCQKQKINEHKKYEELTFQSYKPPVCFPETIGSSISSIIPQSQIDVESQMLGYSQKFSKKDSVIKNPFSSNGVYDCKVSFPFSERKKNYQDNPRNKSLLSYFFYNPFQIKDEYKINTAYGDEFVNTRQVIKDIKQKALYKKQ